MTYTNAILVNVIQRRQDTKDNICTLACSMSYSLKAFFSTGFYFELYPKNAFLDVSTMKWMKKWSTNKSPLQKLLVETFL